MGFMNPELIGNKENFLGNLYLLKIFIFNTNFYYITKVKMAG